MDMKTPDLNRGGYSVDRFAAEHDISRSQVYIEISQGRLVARKVGTRTLITAEDAARWRKSLPQFQIDASAGKTRPVQRGAAS
jgi:hypothetical protein